jgi:tRNA-guanine family transglycosylase
MEGFIYIAAKNVEIPAVLLSSSGEMSSAVETERLQSVEGYSTIDIRLEKYKEDFTPVDNTCNCYLCLNHTKSYLRHLFASGEPLAIRLASMHNLRFYLNLMEKIRTAVQYEHFDEMVQHYKDYTEDLREIER